MCGQFLIVIFHIFRLSIAVWAIWKKLLWELNFKEWPFYQYFNFGGALVELFWKDVARFSAISGSLVIVCPFSIIILVLFVALITLFFLILDQTSDMGVKELMEDAYQAHESFLLFLVVYRAKAHSFLKVNKIYSVYRFFVF